MNNNIAVSIPVVITEGLQTFRMDKTLDEQRYTIVDGLFQTSLRAMNLREYFISKEIAINMDGRGRAFDNIFTERLWRSVKYEEVFIKEYQVCREAREGLEKYFTFYNTRRYHQSLEYKTPYKVYFGVSSVIT